AGLSEAERTQWRYDLARFVALAKPLELLPQLEDVAAIAVEIRNGIERLSPISHWTITIPKNCTIQRTIEPRPRRRAGRTRLDGFQSYYTSDDFGAALLLCAADAIEAEGTQIRVCARKDCGRRFVKHRRARYCSASCSQKERDARFNKRLTRSERSS